MMTGFGNMRTVLVMLIAVFALMACQKQVVSEENSQLNPAEIIGKTWLWQGSYLATGDQVIPENPEEFQITLDENGQFGIRADCNTGGGPVTIEDNKFVFGMYRLTRAYCGDQSLDTSFRNHLEQVARWHLMKGDLMLQLGDQAGFMLFSAKTD